MAETNGTPSKSTMMFDVSFDETDAKPKRPMPKRFQQKTARNGKAVTSQMLADKQVKAEERRKVTIIHLVIITNDRHHANELVIMLYNDHQKLHFVLFVSMSCIISLGLFRV